MNILNLDQFRSAYQTGGLRSVCLMASGGLFFVTGLPRSGERVTLATTRGKLARGFRDPGKAIAILHDMGARKVDVDTSGWLPDKAAAEGRHRPDTAERQRRAHEAAGHDAWFRAEVEKALQEADDPATEWLSNEQVKQHSAERRLRWLAG